MPMDLSRIIQAAAEAALQDQGSGQQAKDKAKDARKGLTTPRALLIGAGVFTVGRLLVASRGRDMLEELQERLAAYESEHFGSGDDEEPEDDYDEDEELPEGEYDEDEEPEGEFDDEEEPEGEFDDEEEPEGEFDEDEEPEAEQPPRRRASSAGSRNGRH